MTQEAKYPGADTSKERLAEIATAVAETPFKKREQLDTEAAAIFDLLAMIEERDARLEAVISRLENKRQQIEEYAAGIDPTAGEMRRHALTIAEGRKLQLDMDLAELRK
ncbi:MAG TPA: hypothetical protein VKE92_08585 [Anaerolineales bacterium]|nr:hypothetical protein [Anaerolineales bacterium]